MAKKKTKVIKSSAGLKFREDKEKSFYVGISKPDEIRRSLLEGARDLVTYLQRYEKLKELRNEKLEKIQEAKSLVKEINSLILKLRREFPKTNLKVQVREEQKPKKIQEVEIPKESIPIPKPDIRRKQVTDIEKLESELAEIEEKLGRI